MNTQEFLDRVSDIKNKIRLSKEAIQKTIEKADKLAEAVEVWKTELNKKIEEKRKEE